MAVYAYQRGNMHPAATGRQSSSASNTTETTPCTQGYPVQDVSV